MLSILAKRARGARTSKIAAAFAASSAGATFWYRLSDQQQREDDEREDLNTEQELERQPNLAYNAKKLLLPLSSRDAIVQCDNGALMMPPPPSSPIRKLGLRRSPTVQRLEEAATTEDRLEDKYHVRWREPLGQGAFGAVFSAVHRETGQMVAVKQINKRMTSLPSFQREMDALLLLRESGGHPHICSMHENFDEGDYYYIVMDLISGGEMFDQLCNAGPYSEADAARHIQDAASALNFLHGIGVVHCDLKPENLMLSSQNDENAVIKLVDLGCAHLERNAPFLDHQQKGTANTPAYCPPEVIRESREKKHTHVSITSAFDMWSLGMVIYIMLVGAHPYDLECCATDKEIEERVLSGEKPPLRGTEWADHLSDDAVSLIEGLLEHDPAKRMTADHVLQNPWVQGSTASSKKIAGSDMRLAAFRRYNTRIGAEFFKTLLSQQDAIHRKDTKEKLSALESAFRRLDNNSDGYLYLANDNVHGEANSDESDAKMSFSDVSSLLAENMKNRYFPKGYVIYNQGDPGDSMYIISSGKVEVSTKDGIKKLRGAGDMLSVGSMSHKTSTRNSTVRCVTPVHLLEISRELFEKYVAADQETFLSIAETKRHRRRERANSILRASKEWKHETYGQGETIFNAGEQGENLYVVEDGTVNISVQGHSVRSLQPGEVTGEHAVYFGKPYNVTAKCISSVCRVQALSSKVMQDLFRADPSLGEDFRDLILRRDFKKAVCFEIKRAFPKTKSEIRETFDIIDKDKSGEIDFEEIAGIVRRFDPTYNEKDIVGMLKSLDLNDSGSLSWEEFYRIFAMDKEA